MTDTLDFRLGHQCWTCVLINIYFPVGLFSPGMFLEHWILFPSKSILLATNPGKTLILKQ